MAINIKNRYDFINLLFDFFRVEKNNNNMTAYDIALTAKFPVDWEAFYEDVIKTTEKKIIPMPKYFADRLRYFRKVVEVDTALDSGSLVRVTLKDGIFYDFTVNNLVQGPSLRDVKKRFEYQDENKKMQTKIKKIVQYPPGTVIIGDHVYFNINVPGAAKMSVAEREQKAAEIENELKKQVKVLFKAQEN